MYGSVDNSRNDYMYENKELDNQEQHKLTLRHVVVKDCIKLYPLWHCADRWSNTQKSVYLKQTPDQYAAICF